MFTIVLAIYNFKSLLNGYLLQARQCLTASDSHIIRTQVKWYDSVTSSINFVEKWQVLHKSVVRLKNETM